MNEFDKLLCDVLAADVWVDPPPGMEHRIEAALRDVKDRRPQARRTPRGAIAAALLIGIAGMLFFRHHSGIARAPESHESFISEASGLRVDPARRPRIKVSQKKEDRPSLVRLVSSGPDSRRTVAGIAPLEVESLVIEPIEIASLASGESTERTSKQGEQR